MWSKLIICVFTRHNENLYGAFTQYCYIYVMHLAKLKGFTTWFCTEKNNIR